MSGPDYFRLPTRLRRPAEIVRLPKLARLQLHPVGQRPRGARRLSHRAAKLLFHWAHQRAHLPARAVLRLRLPDGPCLVPVDGSDTAYLQYAQHLLASGYEPEVGAFLDLVLSGGGAFFDIGANWGHFVLFAATCPGFEGPIHAFEAAPASRRHLERLVRAAGLSGRVTCHPFGLSDHDGALPLVRGRHSALGRLDAEAHAPAVPVRRLDALDLPPPAVIKLDAEGHELAVLQGARAILGGARPVILFENWCSGHDPLRALAPLWFLADLGYDLFHLAWENRAGNHVFLTRMPPATEMALLALVPLRLVERAAWPIALNLVAWPQEGGEALRRHCLAAESQKEEE